MNQQTASVSSSSTFPEALEWLEVAFIHFYTLIRHCQAQTQIPLIINDM